MNPASVEDGYWSIPWTFADAALGFKIGPVWYAEERFKDDEHKEFMQKVEIRTLPEALEAFAKEPEKSVTVLEVKTREVKHVNLLPRTRTIISERRELGPW